MRGNRRTDYSAIYKKEFAEDALDPHVKASIKGQLGAKKRPPMPRERKVEEIREHMERNMKHMILGNEDQLDRPEIWQVRGYYSTDCGEENDETEDKKKKKPEEEDDYEDDEYYYYDEEDEDAKEDEEAKTAAATEDPSTSIDKEREELKMPEIER